MLADTLLSEEVWAEAPEAPDVAFLFFVDAARKKLKELTENEKARGRFDLNLWRQQYIYELETIATELGIKGLPAASDTVKSAAAITDFDAKLARIVTRIKASRRLELRVDSVQLTIVTKQTVQESIEKLRATLAASNLAEDLKERIHKKIDDVEAELGRRRSSLTPFWILSGAFATIMASATSTLADFPDAIDTVQTIIQSVNEDKALEMGVDDRYTDTPLLPNYPTLQIPYDPGPLKLT